MVNTEKYRIQFATSKTIKAVFVLTAKVKLVKMKTGFMQIR